MRVYACVAVCGCVWLCVPRHVLQYSSRAPGNMAGMLLHSTASFMGFNSPMLPGRSGGGGGSGDAGFGSPMHGTPAGGTPQAPGSGGAITDVANDGAAARAAHNVLFVLHCHFNHPLNAEVLPPLVAHQCRASSRAGGLLLLRLLSTALFDPADVVVDPASGGEEIARGAYGSVREFVATPAMNDAVARTRRRRRSTRRGRANTVVGGSGSARSTLTPPRRRVLARTLSGLQFGDDDEGAPLRVAVKLVEVPATAEARCVLARLFTEVSVLVECADDDGVCNLYDFGVTPEHYWLVMERCACTMRHWRIRCVAVRRRNVACATAAWRRVVALTGRVRVLVCGCTCTRYAGDPCGGGPSMGGGGGLESPECRRRLLLYLRLFLAVVEATRQLHERGVTHFDIKCDNTMLRRLPQAGDELHGDTLKRLVCLVDFGESVFTPGTVHACGAVYMQRPSHTRARHGLS